MKSYLGFLVTVLFSVFAFAGVQVYNGTHNLGVYDIVQCSSGMSCSRSAQGKAIFTATLSGISPVSGGIMKNFSSGWKPPTLVAGGTSTTPSATTVYMTLIHVPYNATLTGVKILNGATVGTNKYIAVLFDVSGTVLKNSNLAGITTAGASTYQSLPFTSTYSIVGPAYYWVGIYVNGTTDRFQSEPAVGEIGGLAGTVTGQTFGTAASVTPPSSFTADVGPIVFTY